jgi:hypothetical protein
MTSPKSVEVRCQGAIGGGGEVMRAKVTHGDQDDRPHPLRTAYPNRGNRIRNNVKAEKVSTCDAHGF